MKKWNLGFLSIGCVFIMLSPTMDNQWPLLVLGVVIVILSAISIYKDAKKG